MAPRRTRNRLAVVQPRAAKLTFDELTEQKWQAVYEGCDPAVDNGPQKYSLAWFREGVHCGLLLSGQISDQMLTDDATRAADKQFARGHAQGCADSAFMASQLPLEDKRGVEFISGARWMREAIVQALEAAASADKVRAEA